MLGRFFRIVFNVEIGHFPLCVLRWRFTHFPAETPPKCHSAPVIQAKGRRGALAKGIDASETCRGGEEEGEGEGRDDAPVCVRNRISPKQTPGNSLLHWFLPRKDDIMQLENTQDGIAEFIKMLE